MASKIRREQPPFAPPDALAFERAFLDRLHHWLTDRAAPHDLEHAPEDKAQLWAETPPIVFAMMAKAVLRFLTREGGWRRQPYPEGDQVKQGRIWDTQPLRRLDLRWSGPSVEALYALNTVEPLLAAKTPTKSKAAPPPPPEPPKLNPALVQPLAVLNSGATAGEQLVFYIIARALARQGASGEPLLKALTHNLWLCRTLLGPLLCARGDFVAGQASDADAWTAAWGWTFPWLARTWSAAWVEADTDGLSRGVERFRATTSQLTSTLGTIVERAESSGRLEYMLPVLTFFEHAYAQDPAPRLAMLAALTRSMRIADRQEIQDTWGQLLRVMHRADQIRARIQRTHPADREPSDRLLITYWQAHNLQPTAERVDALRQALERVLG